MADQGEPTTEEWGASAECVVCQSGACAIDIIKSGGASFAQLCAWLRRMHEAEESGDLVTFAMPKKDVRLPDGWERAFPERCEQEHPFRRALQRAFAEYALTRGLTLAEVRQWAKAGRSVVSPAQFFERSAKYCVVSARGNARALMVTHWQAEAIASCYLDVLPRVIPPTILSNPSADVVEHFPASDFPNVADIYITVGLFGPGPPRASRYDMVGSWELLITGAALVNAGITRPEPFYAWTNEYSSSGGSSRTRRRYTLAPPQVDIQGEQNYRVWRVKPECLRSLRQLWHYHQHWGRTSRIVESTSASLITPTWTVEPIARLERVPSSGVARLASEHVPVGYGPEFEPGQPASPRLLPGAIEHDQEDSNLLVRVLQQVVQAGQGGATLRDMERNLRSVSKPEIDIALTALEKSGAVLQRKRQGKRGPATAVWVACENLSAL